MAYSLIPLRPAHEKNILLTRAPLYTIFAVSLLCFMPGCRTAVMESANIREGVEAGIEYNPRYTDLWWETSHNKESNACGHVTVGLATKKWGGSGTIGFFQRPLYWRVEESDPLYPYDTILLALKVAYLRNRVWKFALRTQFGPPVIERPFCIAPILSYHKIEWISYFAAFNFRWEEAPPALDVGLEIDWDPIWRSKKSRFRAVFVLANHIAPDEDGIANSPGIGLRLGLKR